MSYECEKKKVFSTLSFNPNDKKIVLQFVQVGAN